MPDLGFIHRFVAATKPGKPPLLLLHGTGGDENDLIPLGAQLLPGAALLSPRGKVLENGMPRFFRRKAEGVFDLEDLKVRTRELTDFVRRARDAYGLAAPVAVGFSNGANVTASILLSEPDILAGAALLRAMLPFEPPTPVKLAGKPILLLAGAADPFMPAASRERLAALLKQSGAALTYRVLPAGHNLIRDDLETTADWLEHL